MSAWRKEQTDLRVSPEGCSIVVIYENVPARDVAIRYCDALAQKFIGDLEFDITWWRFEYLADPGIALEAGEAAAKADLILISLEHDELPTAIRDWLEQWFPRREAQDGALALVRTSAESVGAGAVDSYLRLAARHARLDYLSHSRTVGPGDRQREDQVTPDITGLRQTQDHPYHSSGWGINE
jgi:hypothetical protein